MSLIFAKMRKHIEGHKYLTNQVDLLKLDTVDTVYIPLANGNSSNFDVLVEAGEFVKVGTNVGVRNDGLVVPVFSSVSGVVKGIVKMPHTLGMIDHVVIENDHKFEKEELKGIDYKTASVEELVSFTMNKGIVGCGGAGFPTYVKYRGATGINKVIINAVECEPYITADDKEAADNIGYLLDGVAAMKKMANANEVVIAFKVGKKDLVSKIKAEITDPSISIAEVPDQYPMGWERSLIRYLEKKEYEGLPSEIGIIVNNSTTAIQLGLAMDTGMPIVDKVVTVSGNAINTPQNLKVLVGTQVKELLEACDNASVEDVLLINGGPMMGQTMENADYVITPYSNAVTLLAKEPINTIACLRCGSCSDHCPAGLQPVRIMDAYKINDLEAMTKLRADLCIECGLCSYVCPSKIDVAQEVIKAKRLVLNAKWKK